MSFWHFCSGWYINQTIFFFFLGIKYHWSLLYHTRWYQRPPVSMYVSEHPVDDCIGFYKVPPRSEHNAALAALLRGPWYFSNNLPSMCLSLLDQAVWRRQLGKEDRQNPSSLHVWSSQIRRDCWLSVSVCLCVCSSERQKWQLYSYANMSYGLTHTRTHTKHLIAKKKSLSRAPLCLICSPLILPFGDNRCCVNYTAPGALINTHTNMCTHQHIHKHKQTMYTT